METPQPASLRPWFLELVPIVVVLLIVAHVLALLLRRRGSPRGEKHTEEEQTLVLCITLVLQPGAGHTVPANPMLQRINVLYLLFGQT
ncbi:unnamed protein product [Malus baccata var. baccata]